MRIYILVPRAHDPSGLQQESRALKATISGMRHRCRLRVTGWAEFGYFLCYFKMVAPRALVFQPLVKGNEALGTRLAWWRSFLVTGNGKRYRSIRLKKIRKFKPEFLVEWNAPEDCVFPFRWTRETGTRLDVASIESS